MVKPASFHAALLVLGLEALMPTAATCDAEWAEKLVSAEKGALQVVVSLPRGLLSCPHAHPPHCDPGALAAPSPRQN